MAASHPVRDNRGMSDTSTRLKAARIAAGLTQRELAERIGVQQSHLSHVESGGRGLSSDTLRLAARVLGSSVAYFIGEADQEELSAVQQELVDDDSVPGGLQQFAHDSALANALAVAEHEWRALRSLDLPNPISKDGYVQLLITLRAIKAT